MKPLYHSLRLRAALLATVAALAACTPAGSGSAAASAPTLPAGDTWVYRCEGDFRFSVRVSPHAAVLWLGGQELHLPNAISASGARYTAEGVTFWSKGAEALLETPSAAYRDCVGQLVKAESEVTRLLSGEGSTGIPLAGTDWNLMSLSGLPARPSSEGALPHLHFSAEDGRVAGSTGCNRIAGDYVVQDADLRFPPPLVTTRMACVDSHLADQERRFVAAIERADGWLVWGSILTLFDDEEVVARFSGGS